MDKKFTKIDKLKKELMIYSFVAVLFLVLAGIFFLFSDLLPEVWVNIVFCVWCCLVLFFVVFLAVLLLKYNKNKKAIKHSKYEFNRSEKKENVKTNYKDCIMQEVEFCEDGFIFNGELVNYNDVNIEYSVYGDNIMMHIYLKALETENPLLIFIVNEEMYFMIKKFKLNLENIDKEINMLNMNYKAKKN